MASTSCRGRTGCSCFRASTIAASSPGPASPPAGFDPLTALETWLATGTAPDTLTLNRSERAGLDAPGLRLARRGPADRRRRLQARGLALRRPLTFGTRMRSFTFQTTGSVLCAAGATARIGEIMAERGCRKVAFVTDATIVGLGLADAGLASLAAAGIDVWTFADVVADPPEAMALAAVATARAEGVDGVVSIGGGSSLDTAKLIAVLAGSDQAIGELYGVGLVRGGRLPLVLAPTTAGTGSEVTPIAIVTTGAAEKKGVVAAQLLPDWAILDAELTVGLPAAVTAATGIDAMVHAIEAFTSRAPEEPRLRLPCPRGAGAARGEHPRRLRDAARPRRALGHAARLDARRHGLRQRAGRRGARARLPARRPFPRAARALERARPAARARASTCPRRRHLYAELAPIVFPELAGRTPPARAAGLSPRCRRSARARPAGRNSPRSASATTTCRCSPRTR